MGIHVGANARKRGEYKGIGWTLQYVEGEEAIVLFKRSVLRSSVLNLQQDKSHGVVVIPLRGIHRFAAQTDEEKRFLMDRVTTYAKVMGFDPHSKFDCKAIADLIDKLIIEVVTMQPEPEELAIARRDGQLIDFQGEQIGPDHHKIHLVIQ